MTVEATSSGEHIEPAAGISLERRWSKNVTLDLVAGADVIGIMLGGYLSALWVGAGSFGFSGFELAFAEILLLTAAVAYLVLRWLGAYNPRRMTELAIAPMRHGLGLERNKKKAPFGAYDVAGSLGSSRHQPHSRLNEVMR